MPKLAVLNVVGLTPRLLPQASFLKSWASRGKIAAVTPILPAVTCSMQSTLLTGAMPSEHGAVGNGWYVRDEGEIRFWQQSNRLVQREKIWEKARRLGIPDFTCANMFWWYNMYSSVDYAATPRPMYPADGRKIPDTWTEPVTLRSELRQKLGPFPLFEFWGPGTTIRSSKWIAQASLHVDVRYNPVMTLMYLPHLDYVLQREGPDGASVAGEVARIDEICEELVTHYESQGAAVMVLSEYGITPVRRSVSLNRILRQEGFLRVREELGRELLDSGASQAFAVADHQVAHVYMNNPDVLEDVRALVAATNGVAAVLYGEARAAHGLNHPRSGDLVAVADPDTWFSYYYWLDDDRAPDFARTVDIHRKPGYDPCELFLDPALPSARLQAGFRLLQKKLGFRYLLDVIPLDPSLVKGSHGRLPDNPLDGPLILSNCPELLSGSPLPATDIQDIMLAHLQGPR